MPRHAPDDAPKFDDNPAHLAPEDAGPGAVTWTRFTKDFRGHEHADVRFAVQNTTALGPHPEGAVVSLLDLGPGAQVQHLIDSGVLRVLDADEAEALAPTAPKAGPVPATAPAPAAVATQIKTVELESAGGPTGDRTSPSAPSERAAIEKGNGPPNSAASAIPAPAPKSSR